MTGFEFFVGCHSLCDAVMFDRVCISVNRLRRRKRRFAVNSWMMDSGAFTEISTHGHYRHGVEEYAREAEKWLHLGDLRCVVAQDWMCEPWIIEKTGLSVIEHQDLTVARYDALLRCNLSAYVLPVIQGYAPADYARHVVDYGDRLGSGAWVGVGSVCKRNGRPSEVAEVLSAIKGIRPDLRLHGFGVKTTALRHPRVRAMLASADSMAWAIRGKFSGGRTTWKTAKAFEERVLRAFSEPDQLSLLP